MKLIIITAVKEFEKDIKNILKNAEIPHFSYTEITGYRNISKEAKLDNWFPGERHETDSIMFYAFIKKEDTDELFEKVKTFNNQQESQSKIHVAVLNVDKSN
jgi:nitrogen regulatory protein PII